jgi:hypothetical protein
MSSNLYRTFVREDSAMPWNVDYNANCWPIEHCLNDSTIYDALLFPDDKGKEDLIESNQGLQGMIAKHKQQGKVIYAIGHAVRAIAELDIMKDVAVASFKSSKQRAATELVFKARQDEHEQLKQNNPYPELIRLGSLIIDVVPSDESDWPLVEKTNEKMTPLLLQLGKVSTSIVPQSDTSIYLLRYANYGTVRDELGQLSRVLECWKTSNDKLQAFQRRDAMTESDFNSSDTADEFLAHTVEAYSKERWCDVFANYQTARVSYNS